MQVRTEQHALNSRISLIFSTKSCQALVGNSIIKTHLQNIIKTAAPSSRIYSTGLLSICQYTNIPAGLWVGLKEGGRKKVVWQEWKEAEMLEGSRSLELNINLWWFICGGSLRAPSAHHQLLAPVSWSWTLMWNAGLLPRVRRHEPSWLEERQWRPGQVADFAGVTICVRVDFFFFFTHVTWIFFQLLHCTTVKSETARHLVAVVQRGWRKAWREAHWRNGMAS